MAGDLQVKRKEVVADGTEFEGDDAYWRYSKCQIESEEPVVSWLTYAHSIEYILQLHILCLYSPHIFFKNAA